MALDPLVRILKVQDTPQLGADLQPVRMKLITFMVGTQGPFELRTPASEYSAAYVERETQKEVDTLRAIGAVV